MIDSVNGGDIQVLILLWHHYILERGTKYCCIQHQIVVDM